VPTHRRRPLVWLPAAENNLVHQLDYIGERNPLAAIWIGDAIMASVERLSDFPESARKGRVQGTRELVITDTPFIVVYRIEAAAIVILRVLHHRQSWPGPEDSAG
jgi:toxin ParE1/3/4